MRRTRVGELVVVVVVMSISGCARKTTPVVQTAKPAGAGESRPNEQPIPALVQAVKDGDLAEVRALLDEGGDTEVKARDSDPTPLCWAAELGHLEIARALLDHGADVHGRNWVGETPLHLAARADQLEMAKLLLEYGADVAARSEFGGPPVEGPTKREIAELLMEHTEMKRAIFKAAEDGDAAKIRELVAAGADPNTSYVGVGRTPLHEAAAEGQLEAMKTLLELGADPNHADVYGATPLHRAAGGGRRKHWDTGAPHHEGARVLIDHGADVNAAKERGVTPLHLAAARNDVETAKLLLAHGAKVNAKTTDGKATPLTFALEGACHPEVADVLREHGGKEEGHAIMAG
jgi:ankyrin repeat protein